MLAYEPGDSIAHRLDARSKLFLQATFAAAAFAHTDPRGLAALTLFAAGVLALSTTPIRVAVAEYRAVLPFLAAAPAIEALRFGSPWVDPAAAVGPALASYRTLLLLALVTAYVRTTPVRESEAAVARVVPGRPGRLLGLGVGLVFRFLPVIQADLARTREATAARLGDERPIHDRIQIVATAGLTRVFDRTDRLTAALRARCLSWTPTPPRSRLDRSDAVAVAVATALLAWAVVP
ncbi:energy-coupling factor transporter transmembrane protein EcfT [Halobaculum sp. CBA1158]|uniref:energy-coupling factor transporter transmembrane component T family protein n=1 Tax=Halobaculum sp. CBA1158 TaxID=2904243 RepID=UPI001F365110|nr:energy-coupling factor transporter transmembrane protein EcfT [Halobaculum sp. CBA1158]UIO98711.1 energy-coupling factor transporter transmembrane protein EcfT [Halobaculum sp. CBA1158]